MADIDQIDALTPADSERSKLGAERIRETRTKLNEVIAKVNVLANVPTAAQEVYSRLKTIYVVDTTQPTIITIPAGITQMDIVGCGGGGGGGWGENYSNVDPSYPIIGGNGGGGAGNYVSLQVTEGESYSVTLGAGGNAGLTQSGMTNGSYSRVTRVADSTVVFEAPGGSAGGNASSGSSVSCQRISSAETTQMCGNAIDVTDPRLSRSADRR